jgi:hypothetical protein
VISAEGFRNFNPVSFNRILHARHPALFAQTPDAIPIMVSVGRGGAKKTGPVIPLLFGFLPQVLTCGLVGSVWESDSARLDVGVMVSDTEMPTTGVEISASRWSHGILFAPVARLFQWPSRGWHRPRGDLAGEEFEGFVNAIADALAATLAKMSPESRAALRKNPVALQRFMKKFPWGFGVQKRGVAEKVIHVYPEKPQGERPVLRIVGQSLDTATLRGEIQADISGCDPVEAQRQLVNVEIPRFCRERLGRDISLLSIQNESQGEDGIHRISFVVVE